MSVVRTGGGKTVLTVDETEIREARVLSECLAAVRESSSASEFEIGPQGGQMVRIPSALAGLMQEIIDGVSRGASVTIHTMPRELTTTTAAKLLGVSRPTLMKMIAEQQLPSHKIGSHTRLKTSDVTKFRQRQRESQRRAFDQLRAMDEELGIEP